jgi:hypothetical protein
MHILPTVPETVLPRPIKSGGLLSGPQNNPIHRAGGPQEFVAIKSDEDEEAERGPSPHVLLYSLCGPL